MKPLSEFMEEEKGSTLVKSLMAEKDGETLIIGLLRNGEHVKFAVLCGKAPGEVAQLCHVREVRDGELYDKVKRILQALGYRVKEVVLEEGESMKRFVWRPTHRYVDFQIVECDPRVPEESRKGVEEDLKDPNSDIRRDIRESFKDAPPGEYTFGIWMPEYGPYAGCTIKFRKIR